MLKWHRIRAAWGARTVVVCGAVGVAGLFTATGVGAQTAPGVGQNGIIVGAVARCVNGVEQPLPNVTISAEGSPLGAVTNAQGAFTLVLPPGQYTITANGGANGSGQIQYVPVQDGQVLDIGTLDVGAASVLGCGADAVAPVVATPVPPTPTAVPATPTPVPAVVPVAPPAPPADQTAPATDQPAAPADDTSAPMDPGAASGG